MTIPLRDPALKAFRPCTCWPAEAPHPCQKKYALSECVMEAARQIDTLRTNGRMEKPAP